MFIKKVEIPVIFEVELSHPDESPMHLTYVGGAEFGEDESCKERAEMIRQECKAKYSYYHDIKITARFVYGNNGYVYDHTILNCEL